MDSRGFPHEIEEDKEKGHVSQTNPKTTTTCYSISNSSDDEPAIEALFSSLKFWSQMQTLLRPLVNEAVDSKFESRLNSSPPCSRNNHLGDDGERMATGSQNYKLCFLNQMPSIIFTNNKIVAKNGKPLKVKLIDVDNSTVSTGPLSIAQLEFVVFDGDLREFDDKRILTQRTGKRPLLVGNDLKINLKNGVGLINSLSITDNSSWLRSKQFRLGIRIADDTILAKFPRIEEAVSQPLDHRGEASKKHCTPKREDKVWRLKGIRKNGVYHNILASKGIETVDDFLKIYNEKGPTYLKKLLGNRFPKNTWKEMEKNVLECVDPKVNFAPDFEVALNPKFQDFDEDWATVNFQDVSSPLFPSGEGPSSSAPNNPEGREASAHNNLKGEMQAQDLELN